jgi:hypothetical protein
MPFKASVDKQLGKVANSFGNTVYPVLLSLGLPVFLYTLVLEKEQRLI